MRRPWLFKGNAMNKEPAPCVGVLAGRGQSSEKLQKTAGAFHKKSSWNGKWGQEGRAIKPAYKLSFVFAL